MLPASIVIAALIIGGSIVYLVHSNQALHGPTGVAGVGNTATTTTAAPPATADRDVVLGDANAPVSIIEYGDYQCPFCGAFFKDTEPVIRTYIQAGKAKMVFRNFSFLGPESDAAAAAAECAVDQHHFWEYHDALYDTEVKEQDAHPGASENSGNLTRALFIKLATDLKLDVPAFTQCIDKNTYATTVQQQTQNAQQYGVQSTPTVFINGQKFEGALPTTQFTAAIDAALK
jgi:protein-disulfide isomerase